MQLIGKKILMITSDSPYPPNHGGRLDVWRRIKVLYNLGLKIDLITTLKRNEQIESNNELKKYIRNLYIVKRKNKLHNMISIYPLQIKSREYLREIKLEDYYDFILLEGHYVYFILRNPHIKYKEAILRVHNIESIYFKELSKSERVMWKKLYFLIESYKFKLIEFNIKKSIKNLLFISKDEYDYFNRHNIGANSIFMPPHVDPINIKKQPLNSKKVLFIGSLFMVNNCEAIKWYIENVHQKLININEYEFIIAGNSRGSDLKWLKELIKYNNNIKLILNPRDLDELYKNSCVFVNPMLHGAGVKMKTIDAIQNGLPVISTTVGNQGTGLIDGKHILIANDPHNFTLHIKNILNEPSRGRKIVEEAQQYLLENYDQKLILKKYLENISKDYNILER